MKTGTTIGLLVGGAVLILAAAPRRGQLNPQTGQVMPGQAAPFGMLNPFNWFSGMGAGVPAGVVPEIPNGAQFAPPSGFQQAGYSPALSQANFNGFSPYQGGGGFTPDSGMFGSPAGGTPTYQGGYQQVASSPNWGGYSPNFTPIAGGPANSSPNFQSGGYYASSPRYAGGYSI